MGRTHVLFDVDSATFELSLPRSAAEGRGVTAGVSATRAVNLLYYYDTIGQGSLVRPCPIKQGWEAGSWGRERTPGLDVAEAGRDDVEAQVEPVDQKVDFGAPLQSTVVFVLNDRSVHTNQPHSGGGDGHFCGRVVRLATRQGLLDLSRCDRTSQELK